MIKRILSSLFKMKPQKPPQATSNPQRPPNPRRVSYRFIMRSVKAKPNNATSLIEIRIKGYYLKEFLGASETEDAYQGVYQQACSLFKSRKMVYKTLRHTQISSFFQQRVNENLKKARGLQSCIFEVLSDEVSHQRMLFNLSKLSPTVKNIRLCVYLEKDYYLEKKTIYGIARCIHKFPKLESFRRYIRHFTLKRDYFEKEMTIYSRATLRLKKMKKMIYRADYEQNAFQRAMRRGVIYPGITGLKLTLRLQNFSFFERIRNYCRDEVRSEGLISLDLENMKTSQKSIYRKAQSELKHRDEEYNDDIAKFTKILKIKEDDYNDWRAPNNSQESEEFYWRCIMREDAKSLYRFELFPNLKELVINQVGFLVPLGPFVVEGFRALQNLESIYLSIPQRSVGTSYIFKALLVLPLVKNFRLFIKFLRDQDWARLQNFIEKQSMIKSFDLSVTDEPLSIDYYFDQNSSLSSALKSLEKKPFLRSLNLGFPFFSFVALSEGLADLPILPNQLESFEFRVFDDCVTSDKEPQQRVEGLCRFLQSQKKSLKKVRLGFCIALDEDLVTKIVQTTSESSQLKEVEILLNYDMEEYDTLWRRFQDGTEMKKPKKWNPEIAKNLKKLKHLEKFSLKLGLFSSNVKDMDYPKWFLDLIYVLPTFENLRTLRIRVNGAAFLMNTDQSLSNSLDLLYRLPDVYISV